VLAKSLLKERIEIRIMRNDTNGTSAFQKIRNDQTILIIKKTLRTDIHRDR